MKVRIAVVKTPAPQAARSPSGTPVTSSLHPPCLPISLDPTTGRPSNISVRRKIRRGLPDEARRRPLTSPGTTASRRFYSIASSDSGSKSRIWLESTTQRIVWPSRAVLSGATRATPGVFGHLRDALQVDGLLPGRLEVDIFFGAHALYDLRLDIYAARALSPTQGLGRLGLGILHVLGTDAEHDLLASMLPEVLSPSLLYLPHYLAAEGYA